MEWRRHPSGDPQDPEGIGGLLQRLTAELGGHPLQGSRFAHDSSSMRSALRELEARCAGIADKLYVGFQDARNLEQQQDIYSAITSTGTRVLGFGSGSPDVDIPGLQWVPVPTDPFAVANQRFLVARDPEPTALVGFATRPASHEGHNDGGEPETNSWEGFATGDARVVDALLGHLGDLAGRLAPA